MPSSPLSPAASLTATQAAALDDPAGLDDFTRWHDGPAGERLGQSRLLLSGLHCAACAGLIEDALLAVPGVREAEVSGAAQRATVLWDPQATQPSWLVRAVQRAGYGAFPDTGAEAVALATRQSRSALWQFFVAGFCMMQVMMYAAPAYVATPGDMGADLQILLRWASWVLTVPVMLFAAGPYFRGAWRALRQRRIGMDVPVALGLAVTFVASSAATFDSRPGQDTYFDSLTMFVAFLLAARLLEMRARRQAAQALDAVMRRLPDAVERLDAEGAATLVRTAQLVVGDRIRVQAGQAFAADGRVLVGHTEVDESMLTGESRPVPRGPGEPVSAGCLNLAAAVEVEVLALGGQTRYQRIVALVERALMQRPAFVQATDRLAAPFLWGVLLLAGAAWLAWHFIDPGRALWVAVSVLIVTCPCALSLGAPVALLASAGELARRGVLVQRLDALEVLTQADTWVFDKTGTLTEDRLRLAHEMSLSPPPAAGALWQAPQTPWLAVAAGLAAQSAHPLCQALRHACAQSPASPWRVLRDVPGQGLEGQTQPEAEPDAAPQTWRLGSAEWCGALALQAPFEALMRPAVWLARQEGEGGDDIWQPMARFEFDEALRADAQPALAALRSAGLSLHLLSGDHAGSVQAMAARLGVADARARCTPDDKLAAVQALQQAGHTVVMVGDGVNDAPVLARADVSIALGSAAALAQARADVIVLGNQLNDLVLLRATAARTMRIVRQNLGWAVAYNVASVPLALVGWLPPWLAGIGMAASSLAVVLNALRLTRHTALRQLAPGAPTAPAASSPTALAQTA
jgi:Cu2+-exporting ATPase